MDYKYEITQYLKRMGFPPEIKAVDKTIEFLNIIYSENKKINLIGTKDKDIIFIRHFLDCLSVLKFKDVFFYDACNIADIGTGGGLPGLLLAMHMPSKKFFLFEKSLKKVNFLNFAIASLELDNVSIIRDRAEVLGAKPPHRERYDIVTARAVAGFGILLELVIPFCKINGKIILYKSRKVFKDIEENEGFINNLGCSIAGIEKVNVPGLDEYRAILYISKDKKTIGRYPRSYAKIKKSPAKY